MEVNNPAKKSSPMEQLKSALEATSLDENLIEPIIPSQQSHNLEKEPYPRPVPLDWNLQPIIHIPVLNGVGIEKLDVENPTTLAQESTSIVIRNAADVKQSSDGKKEKESKSATLHLERNHGDNVEFPTTFAQESASIVIRNAADVKQSSNGKKDIVHLEKNHGHSVEVIAASTVDLEPTISESLETLESNQNSGANNGILMIESHEHTSSQEYSGDYDNEYVPDPDDTNLYCSDCFAIFTIKDFYKHLTVTHNIQLDLLSSSRRFTIPGLIPKNHAEHVTKKKENLGLIPTTATPTITTTTTLETPDRRDETGPYCQKCDIKFENKDRFNIHMKSVHSTSRNSTIIHPDITPDVNDPNFYCRACEKKYRNLAAYGVHLLRIHLIIRDSTKKKNAGNFPDRTAVPDPNNPDFYCPTCQLPFATKSSYHTHIAYIHFISIGSRGVPALPCEICSAVYIREDYLREHLLLNHNMEIISTTTVPQMVSNNNSSSPSSRATGQHNTQFVKRKLKKRPDTRIKKEKIGNSGLQRSVEQQLDVKPKSVKSASKVVSGMILHPEIVPDENASSFYCQGCEKKYTNRGAFRLHISRVHGIILKPLGRVKPIANPDVVPDEFDTNNYCSACEVQFTTFRTYRHHLRFKHLMTLTRINGLTGQAAAIVARGRGLGGRRNINFGQPFLNTAAGDTGDAEYADDDKSKLNLDRSSATAATALPYSSRLLARRKTQSVNSHVLPNDEDPNYYCGACDRIYTTRTMFIKHLQKIHQFSPNGRRLNWSTKKEEHNLQHDTQPKSFTCQVCHHNSFSSIDILKDHIREAHKKILAPISSMEDFTCQLCQSVKSNKRDLADHLTFVHCTPTKPDFPQKLTDATGTSQTDEINGEEIPLPTIAPKNIPDHHKNRVSKMPVKIIGCDRCRKSFKNKYLLGRHRESAHNIFFVYDREGLYCNLCTNEFTTESGYHNHLKNQHLIDDIPLIEAADDEVIIPKYISTPPVPSPAAEAAQRVLAERAAEVAANAKVKKEKLVVKTNGVIGTLKRKRPTFTVPDTSDPNNTYCRVCDLSYNNATHYRLHCFKFHDISI